MTPSQRWSRHLDNTEPRGLPGSGLPKGLSGSPTRISEPAANRSAVRPGSSGVAGQRFGWQGVNCLGAVGAAQLLTYRSVAQQTRDSGQRRVIECEDHETRLRALEEAK